jgi:hypothetical protein
MNIVQIIAAVINRQIPTATAVAELILLTDLNAISKSKDITNGKNA